MLFSKKIAFALVGLSHLCVPSEHNYNAQALQWATSTITTYSPESATKLLSFFYWSFQRSHQTLCVQEAWRHDREFSETIGYHIAHTRRNPSRTKIESNQSAQGAYTRSALINNLQNYQLTNIIYTNFLDTLYHHPHGDTRVISDTKDLRSKARKAITQRLTNSLTHLQTQFIATKEELYRAAQHIKKLFFLRTRPTRFLQHLWDYFPNLMFHSFVTFDETNTELQWACSRALFACHLFSQDLWNLIEQERAQYYAAYYRASFATFHVMGYQPEKLPLFIAENDILIPSTCMLPLPDNLTTAVLTKNNHEVY